jgi:hypothetical protein
LEERTDSNWDMVGVGGLWVLRDKVVRTAVRDASESHDEILQPPESWSCRNFGK